ncbi:hypothetical protein FKW77_001431 [Venturia effusa]|uniref:Anticodon-binding domain-containing protein n=1 Tax=Venturia effusa TaxID=50376 RepID=A0A517LET6_9PEZI|nr:hypothetical protein FKW77_001431 [Venturia effusa]
MNFPFVCTKFVPRKYRDELRPRQGLLRAKEFVMKDLYTFDTTEKAALATYQSVRAGYRKFFEGLGVPYVEVEASSGTMGGSLSHEYHFLSPLGEDTIIICESCGFAANEEILPKKAEGQDNHRCPRCTGSKISTHRAIEIGHTFHLGTRYTNPLGVSTSLPATAQSSAQSSTESHTEATDPSEQSNSISRVPLQMGCHGIGVSRLIGAVAAMTADEKGLAWPPVMAPYQVVIVFDGPSPPVNPSVPEILNGYGDFARRIGGIKYRGSWGNAAVRRLAVLFDDRDRPLPWKLKDADLTGHPIIIVVGKSFKQSGKYEIQCRSSPQLNVTSDSLAQSLVEILNQITPKTNLKPNRYPWRLGSGSGRRRKQNEAVAWEQDNNPKHVPHLNGDTTLSQPGQDGLVHEHRMGNEGRPGKSVKPVCETCGRRHFGMCWGRYRAIPQDDLQSAYRPAEPNASEVDPNSRERTTRGEQERFTQPLDNRTAPQHINTTTAEDRSQRDPRQSELDSMSSRRGGIPSNLNHEQAQRNHFVPPYEEFLQNPSHSVAGEERAAARQPSRRSKRYEAPSSPPPSTSIQEQSVPPKGPVLSHEHLLERVTLLERLMALKAEEDALKKQIG